MFRYPSGRNVMNSIIWLVGAFQFSVGVIFIILNFLNIGSNGLAELRYMFGPQFEMLLASGLLFVGIMICISSFPTLIFAEVHMYSRQNNKMMKKMYDRLKN